MFIDKAVVEIMPYLAGLARNKAQCLDDFDIPLLLSHTVVDIVGVDRVESVTIAPVDENRRPIMEKAESISCDTILLSVGLIPENELTREAGIKINPITNGPEVNQFMQTSCENIFACGNVLQVHDLVDYVTEESQIAGLGAAKFIKGEKVTGECVYTKGVNGVRYIVPQRINHDTDADVKLYFRVGQVYKGAAFWDTEMFMMPFFSFADSALCKNLVNYRINTIEGAKRKAKEFGFDGAFYAWEAQETGDDACYEQHIEHHGKTENICIDSDKFTPKRYTGSTVCQIDTCRNNGCAQQPNDPAVRNMQQCGKQSGTQQHKGNNHEKQSGIPLVLTTFQHIPFEINA